MELIALEQGALLHDIGKIGVRDSILLKRGALDQTEWLEMREHINHGLRIINGIDFLKGAAPVVGEHHEKFDGSGYPLGLRGEMIHINARIFAVADAFDAITSDRPYRQAASYADARREIVTNSAIHFDPAPLELEEALSGIDMGHAARVVIRLRDCFWDRDVSPSSFHHPRFSFLVSDHPVMPTWWTNYPLLTPFLTGWVAGPRAAHLLARSDQEVQSAALRALAEILGWTLEELADEVVETYFHNWSRDPYAQGAYSYVRVGGLHSLRALAEPIADTLYFAGEAINTEGHTGTVHGALATGNRAAGRILDHRS
jgi:hypothetical protein